MALSMEKVRHSCCPIHSLLDSNALSLPEFDGDVVGACADPSIPINRRKLIIKEYITVCSVFSSRSRNSNDSSIARRNPRGNVE